MSFQLLTKFWQPVNGSTKTTSVANGTANGGTSMDMDHNDSDDDKENDPGASNQGTAAG